MIEAIKKNIFAVQSNFSLLALSESPSRDSPLLHIVARPTLNPTKECNYRRPPKKHFAAWNTTEYKILFRPFTNNNEENVVAQHSNIFIFRTIFCFKELASYYNPSL